MQAYCGDVGNVIHRLGPKHYKEASSWLLLGIAIARWMKIGRDDAHGEMIMGKIYTELENSRDLLGSGCNEQNESRNVSGIK